MSNIATTAISYLAINPPVAYSVPQKGGVSAAEYSALKRMEKVSSAAKATITCL